jgi:hypothetical protein
MQFLNRPNAARVCARLLLLYCALHSLSASLGAVLLGPIFLMALIPCVALACVFLAAIWRLWRKPGRSRFVNVTVALGVAWSGIPLAVRLYQGVFYHDVLPASAAPAESIELVYQGHDSPTDHVLSLDYLLTMDFAQLRVEDDVFVAAAPYGNYRRQAGGQPRPRYRVTERVIKSRSHSWAGNWPGHGDIEISVLDTQTGKQLGLWHGPEKDGWRGPMAMDFLTRVLRPVGGTRTQRYPERTGSLLAVQEVAGPGPVTAPKDGKPSRSACPPASVAMMPGPYVQHLELHANGWIYGMDRHPRSIVCGPDGFFVFYLGGYADRDAVKVIHLSTAGQVLGVADAVIPELAQRFAGRVPLVESAALDGAKLAFRTGYYLPAWGKPAASHEVANLEVTLDPVARSSSGLSSFWLSAAYAQAPLHRAQSSQQEKPLSRLPRKICSASILQFHRP